MAGQILANMQEEDTIGPPWLLPFVPYVEKDLDSSVQDYSTVAVLDFDPIKKVREWLSTCDRLHGGTCGTQATTSTGSWSRPLLLIDVIDCCLVATPDEARYIALSYTWGRDSASITATLENVASLQKPNSLSTLDLPQVISDSITFVHRLGERYLWVDRLCVIQDSSSKQTQLNAMGSIYANSYFTLVAAKSADASGPLYHDRSKPWSGKIRRPPSLIKHNGKRGSNKLGGKKVMVMQAQHLMRTPWYTRAWTFQEYLFSKRRVVFQGDTVNWECLHSAWHELQDLSYEKPAIPYLEVPLTGLKTPPWPDMLRFARLVSIYSIRELTFPEDALDAFAGTLTHLSRTFQGAFISGLPQMCFDAALLWQPWKGRMTRRQSVRCPAAEAILPSWSWVGWSGSALNSESWRSAAFYQYEELHDAEWQQCSWRTISTVAWRYSEWRTSAQMSVDVTFHPAEIGDALPEGWFKSNQSYHHNHCPNEVFRSPVPICDPDTSPSAPISARYLHCTTNRATLIAGVPFESPAALCTVIDLLIPGSSTWSGVIRLDQTAEQAITLWQSLELIEISRGSVEHGPAERRSFDEWERGTWPTGGGVYEFYNVLWVEWTGDVAYRKACGRVERSVWESLDREIVSITLG